jgi:hypothetical protein
VYSIKFQLKDPGKVLLSIIAINETLLYYSFENETAYLSHQKQEEQSEWAPTEEQKASRRQIMEGMVEALNLTGI